MSETTKSAGQVCLGWWGDWFSPASDQGRKGPDRASMARLRRVRTPLDAVLIPAVQDLCKRLAGQGFDLKARPDRLALIAVALAACSHAPGRRAAAQFGTPSDQPTVSPLRFNALVRQTDPNTLRQPLVRALGQIKGAVDVAALASDLFYWNDTTRTRWAFDYYGAGDALAKQELETTP